MSKIAVLLDNPFTNDRRVLREVQALSEAGYLVTLFCVRSEGLPEEEKNGQYDIRRIFYQDIYDFRTRDAWQGYAETVEMMDPDVIHAHDQVMLHLGAILKRRSPRRVLVYDSHELFHAWPLNVSRLGDPWLYFKSWLVRKILIRRERKNARHIDHLITVNGSLARDLQAYFCLRNTPCVLRNIPEYQETVQPSDILREHFQLDQKTRILVFIGSAVYRRTLNLEQVMEETAGVPDLALVIISGMQGGKKELMEYSRSKKYRHVYFYPKLKPEEIAPVLSGCDAGLVPTWNRKDLSYWFALDNKLFEYMMSGLPVLATRQPEYLGIVEEYRLGVCINPDEKGAYAEGWKEILSGESAFRESVKQACKVLNWENEKQVLLSFYRKILAS